MKQALLVILFTVFCQISYSQQIRLNQIGFYPSGEKLAVVPGEATGNAEIVSADNSTVVYSGGLSSAKVWTYSNENVKIFDFSSFNQSGRFRIRCGNFTSEIFDVTDNVHLSIMKGALRGFFYNRASQQITSQHGNIFARPLGHPDNQVYVHASAATAERPENFVISSPKGWYDAGDYNKYVVNSGISTYTILALYEHYSDYFQNISLNIPESGNTIPDVLDEALWNVDWMLTMQDPNDGGVYHKLTTKTFGASVLPHQNTAERYVVQKSTNAALNFAAVMAVAGRILKKFEAERPGQAQQCIDAAIAAYNWARANPSRRYVQPEDIRTGAYDDANFNDEFIWAATELFITTSDIQYYNHYNIPGSSISVPDWATVTGLAWISIAHHLDSIPVADRTNARNKYISFCNGLYNTYMNSAYRVVMGNSSWNFIWGSNGIAANQGMMLLNAYHLTDDENFLKAALSNLDYLLGRNPTGYCFVTGYGSKSPKNIHHRMSVGYNLGRPVPGLIAGGPHNGQQDGCTYPSSQPAMSYADLYCSYSTNEIAINWNAPLAYLLGGIQAIISSGKNSPAILFHPSSRKAQIGQSATFNLFASGENLQYQWQKNGVNIPGATSANLTLSNVNTSDEAVYRAIVYSGTDSVISYNASLTILVKGPFEGVRQQIPGIILVERYDEGGPGQGYHDTSPGNSGGAYRDEDVDIGGSNGNYTIGWTAAGEWLAFSVTVTEAGSYPVEFRTATPNAAGFTGAYRLELNGTAITTDLVPPSTGGWNTYETTTIENVYFPAGNHELRLHIVSAGFNIGYIKIGNVSGISKAGGFGMNLYPNPSQDRFVLEADHQLTNAILSITDLNGREIMSEVINGMKVEFGENITKGYYIGKIISEDKVQSFELIKY
ncbi:MAG: glycoside hydrolase family 9 protein [Cytophagaceae bacterium]